MSEPTAKALTQEARRASLVRNPGTDDQRAIRTLRTDADYSAAVDLARRNYPGQPLALLHHATATLEHLPEAAEEAAEVASVPLDAEEPADLLALLGYSDAAEAAA